MAETITKCLNEWNATIEALRAKAVPKDDEYAP